jgi:hypothetical protein
MTEVIGAWKVHCSLGPRMVRRGSQWRDMLTGTTWEVVEPTGSRIYSPSGFGGTMSFWCKPVGKLTEAAKLWPAREDGCVDFCGDSIAAGLIKPSDVKASDVRGLDEAQQ